MNVSADIHAFMQAANDAAARAELGLGTIATQNSNAIAATGGTITGLTDFGVNMGTNVAMTGFVMGTITDTTSRPFAIYQTWNNVSGAFTGLRFAATITAAASTSKLIDLLGGAAGTTSLFSINSSTGMPTFGNGGTSVDLVATTNGFTIRGNTLAGIVYQYASGADTITLSNWQVQTGVVTVAAANGGAGNSNRQGYSLVLSTGASQGNSNSTNPSVIVKGSYIGSSGTSTNTPITLCTFTALSATTGCITVAEAVDYILGTTTGTKFGTSTSQKMSWWNATPVVQQVLATGGGATVDNVISLLQTLGLCRQS